MIGVGDKVVCIKQFPNLNSVCHLTGDIPIVKEVYTVSRILKQPEGVFLFLEEVHVYHKGADEAAYTINYFKPVIKTDISIFLKIAEKPHKKILEDA